MARSPAARAARRPGSGATRHAGLGDEKQSLRTSEGSGTRSAGITARSHAEEGRSARLLAVHLAERMPEQAVADHAGRLDGGEHLRDAGDHVARAQDGRQLVLVVHAILDGEHAGLRPHHGADGLRGRLGVERLHAEEHEIGRRQPVQPLHRGGADVELALQRRLDAEPIRLDGPEMLAPRHEGHVLSCAGELGPEESARAPAPHHHDAHQSQSAR